MGGVDLITSVFRYLRGKKRTPKTEAQQKPAEDNPQTVHPLLQMKNRSSATLEQQKMYPMQAQSASS
jgi:hypothetical protein